VTIDLAKDRTLDDTRHVEPCSDRTNRAGRRAQTERSLLDLSAPFLVGLALSDHEVDAGFDELQVGNVERD